MKYALLLPLLLPGCALFQPCPVDGPAEELATDVDDFTSDGGVDATETAMLQKGAQRVHGALEQKSRSMTIPKTGIPWLDLAVTAAAAVFGAHKTVNWSRDRKRRQRGEPVTANILTRPKSHKDEPSEPQ